MSIVVNMNIIKYKNISPKWTCQLLKKLRQIGPRNTHLTTPRQQKLEIAGKKSSCNKVRLYSSLSVSLLFIRKAIRRATPMQFTRKWTDFDATFVQSCSRRSRCWNITSSRPTSTRSPTKSCFSLTTPARKKLMSAADKILKYFPRWMKRMSEPKNLT